MERFIVKHYVSQERPVIKGNGFDDIEICGDRDEAEEFVEFVNRNTQKQSAEIERLNAELKERAFFLVNEVEKVCELTDEVERLNALVAMQSEVLLKVCSCDMNTANYKWVRAAIDATAETVSAWQSKRDNEIRTKMIPSKIVSLQKPYGHPQQTDEQLHDEELVAKGWNMCVDAIRTKQAT